MTAQSRMDRIEIFAKAIVAGKTQADAYREAYPKSLKWTPDTLHHRAHEMAKNGKVMDRIDELRKEVTKEFVWTRVMSLKVLAKIAANNQSKDSDKINAVKELNTLCGFNAPQKLDHTSSDGTMTPRSTIDMSKLSESALEEIMNAKV